MCAFHSVSPAGQNECCVLGSIGFNSSFRTVTELMFDKEHALIVVSLVSCQFSWMFR